MIEAQYRDVGEMNWSTPDASITLDQIDEAVRKLVEYEKDYDVKKKVSNDASALFETQRTYILNLLQASGRSKYHAPGIGTVSMAIKSQIKVPHDPLSKKEMLEYFASLGPELFNSYVSVNHNVLNSYYKQQVELDPDFQLPGIGGKTETPELRLRKEK